MFAKIVVIACIQFAVFDVIASQCIRNVLPSCGCSGLDILPGPVCFNQPGYANVISGLSPSFINGQYALPGATNIIQDNSVANNLANTLQLLLVSNLLSNTLPNTGDLIVPGCSCSCSPYGGLSYVV